jgi:hypothetical protein
VGVARIGFNGLAENLDGLVQPPPGEQGVAQVEASLFRIDRVGLAEGVDGFVQLPLLAQDEAEVPVRSGGCRVEFAGLAVEFAGLVEGGVGVGWLFLSRRAMPRLRWAWALFGSSSMALRERVTASSSFPWRRRSRARLR